MESLWSIYKSFRIDSRTFVPMPHYNDVIMGVMASQITSLTIVNSTVYSGAYQSKHQSSASLAFARGIHRGPVNSPHKGPVTRKMFPFDDVIMSEAILKERSTNHWYNNSGVLHIPCIRLQRSQSSSEIMHKQLAITTTCRCSYLPEQMIQQGAHFINDFNIVIQIRLP